MISVKTGEDGLAQAVIAARHQKNCQTVTGLAVKPPCPSFLNPSLCWTTALLVLPSVLPCPQDYRKYTVPTGVCGNPIPTEVCGNLVPIVDCGNLVPMAVFGNLVPINFYGNFGAI